RVDFSRNYVIVYLHVRYIGHRCTRLPYTPLCRSAGSILEAAIDLELLDADPGDRLSFFVAVLQDGHEVERQPGYQALEVEVPARSEEHTSELQSRENLVCRLLIE